MPIKRPELAIRVVGEAHWMAGMRAFSPAPAVA